MGWEGDSKSLSYTGASLEAEMDMLAGFSQGASSDVGRITISSITPLTRVKGGEAQLVNACVLSVYSLFCTGNICLRLHCTGLSVYATVIGELGSAAHCIFY